MPRRNPSVLFSTCCSQAEWSRRSNRQRLAAAVLVAITAATTLVVVGAVAAGWQAVVAQTPPAAGGVLAIALAFTVGLAVGCCCGCGWGLLLGSSSPRLVGQLLRVGSALAAFAAAQPAAVLPRPRAQLPVQVLRRPAFLLEEA